MAKNFDIEVARAELEAFKSQYNEIMALYSYVKSLSLPKELFPSIEAKIHNVEKSIEKHSILIANYDDLNNTMKLLDSYEEEFKGWNKDLE